MDPSKKTHPTTKPILQKMGNLAFLQQLENAVTNQVGGSSQPLPQTSNTSEKPDSPYLSKKPPPKPPSKPIPQKMDKFAFNQQFENTVTKQVVDSSRPSPQTSNLAFLQQLENTLPKQVVGSSQPSPQTSNTSEKPDSPYLSKKPPPKPPSKPILQKMDNFAIAQQLENTFLSKQVVGSSQPSPQTSNTSEKPNSPYLSKKPPPPLPPKPTSKPSIRQDSPERPKFRNRTSDPIEMEKKRSCRNESINEENESRFTGSFYKSLKESVDTERKYIQDLELLLQFEFEFEFVVYYKNVLYISNISRRL